MAEVRAEKHRQSAMNLAGSPRVSLATTVRVLPVPVGPTHATLWPCVTSSSSMAPLRCVSSVGTSMSATNAQRSGRAAR